MFWFQQPILVVKETKNCCTVHLLGVSHGATPSAELAAQYISDVKPTAVVLGHNSWDILILLYYYIQYIVPIELCDERMLSICLDSRLPMSGLGNGTLDEIYQSKMNTIIEKEEKIALLFPNDVDAKKKYMYLVSNIKSYLKFVTSQGL